MKPSQVNKLYSKLTLHERAAMAFGAMVRRDEAEMTAITDCVPRQAYEMRHSDYVKRYQMITSMSLFYGVIWWSTYARLIKFGNNGERLANIDAALVEVCRRIKVDIEAVRTLAMCKDMPDFSEYAEAEAGEIAEYTELFIGFFN